MGKFGDFKFLRLAPLAAFFFALPALAQFEVAPDHFESNAKNAGVRKSEPTNKAALARPTVSSAAGHGRAGAIAKGHKKSTLGSDARSTGGRLNTRTHAAPAARVLRSRNAHGDQEKESNVAKATPTLSQRE